MFFFLMGSARHGRRPFSGSLSSGFQDLSGNSFRGELPECLKFLSQLRVLELDNNLFTGKIPLSWQWRLTHLSKFSQTCVVFAWGCKAHFLNQFAVFLCCFHPTSVTHPQASEIEEVDHPRQSGPCAAFAGLSELRSLGPGPLWALYTSRSGRSLERSLRLCASLGRSRSACLWSGEQVGKVIVGLKNVGNEFVGDILNAEIDPPVHHFFSKMLHLSRLRS